MSESIPSHSTQVPYRRLILLFLLVLMWVLYAQTLHAPFVYDDKIEVVGNPTIRFWDEWKEILLYNPARALLQISYAYNFSTSRFDPFDYHLTNLLLHSIHMIVVFWTSEQIAKLGKFSNTIVFASLLTAWWGLHPMLVESVTYITGRSELLCGLFAFLAIGSKSKSMDTEDWRWELAAWTSIGCACLVKEVGAVLPLIFVLLEWTFQHHVSKRSIGLLVAGALSFLSLRTFVVWKGLVDPTLISTLQALIPNEVERPLPIQLLTQMEVWLRYIGLWLVPYNQTLFHHIPDAQLTSWETWGWLVGWIAMILVALRSSKTNPVARFAFLGGCIVLLPSSSFAALQENMAEHRSHQFGWYLAVFCLGLLWNRMNTGNLKPVSTAIACLALGMGIATYQRNQVWQSEVRLWQEATLINPDSAKAWYGLGDAHRFAKQFEPAMAAFSTCTRLDPMEMDCWNNWGIVYAEMSNTQKAREIWLKALEHNSAYCKAHSNLGFLSYRQEEWDNALVEFRSALVYCPTNIIAHYGLGLLYYGPRLDAPKAIHHFDAVLQIDPTFDYAADARKKLLDLTW